MWGSISVSTAVVASAVSVVLPPVLRRVWAWLQRTTASWRADHSTRFGGQYGGAIGERSGVLCVVRIAPSRKFGRRALRSSPTHDALTAFAVALAPDIHRTPTYHVSNGLTRFAQPRPHQDLGAEVLIFRSGVVEAATPLSGTEDPTVPVRIDLRDVVAAVVAVADVVRDGQYRVLFNTRRRLDWSVAISHSVQRADGAVPWAAVEVDGKAVGGRAEGQFTAQAMPQFGADQLQGLRQRTDGHRIAKAALGDWLRRSGYWQYDAGLNRALAPVVSGAGDEMDTRVGRASGS